MKLKEHIVRKRMQRLTVAVLILALLVSQTDILTIFDGINVKTVAAAEIQNSTISAFIDLPEEIREQTVSVGMPLEDLLLPDTLEAVCMETAPMKSPENGSEEDASVDGEDRSEESLAEDVIIENVTWQPESEFDGDVEGEYIFTAILPEGYLLADGVNLPQITVRVSEITLLAAGDIMPIAATITTISSLSDLQQFRDSVNSGNTYSGVTVKLTANIDLAGTNWTPIGTSSYPFEGTFDGGYHIISNLTINAGSRYCGLFGKLTNASIKNLGIENANVTSSYNDVAALAGNAQGGSISRCYVTGTVKGKGAVSGILGSTHSKSYTTEIDNCYVRVAIVQNGTYTKDLAGISGWNETTSVKITNCYSACTGEIRPIAGWSDGGAVQNGQFVSTYFDATLSPDFSSDAGRADLGRTSDQLKQQTTYTDWDFSSIWAIDPQINGGYPYLRGFAPGLGGAPGSVTVEVTDSSGNPVTGAKVVLKDSSGSKVELGHEGNGVYSSIVTVAGQYEIIVNSKTEKTITYDGSTAVKVQITVAVLATYYTITYAPGTGTGITGSAASGTKTEGEDFTLPGETFKRTGYIQDGWATKDGGAKVYDLGGTYTADQDITLYPHWTAETYTISYTLNGGKATGNPTSYTIESNAITLNAPTRNGYTFAGWGGTGLTGTANKSVTIPKGSTGERSYTAYWTPISYPISYTLNGGTVTGNPTSYTIESNAITLNAPTRNGYTFAGWGGTGLTGTANKSVIIPKGSTGERSYTAYWTANGYTVTYEKNGGTITNESVYEEYTYGEGLTLPIPTRDGYIFLGWYENADLSGNPVESITADDTGNRTFYAKWIDGGKPDAPVLYGITELPVDWTNTQDTIPLLLKDNIGVTELWVKVDGGADTKVASFAGTDTEVTYSYPAVEGKHTYLFYTKDEAANTSGESTFTLMYDNTQPTIRLDYSYEPKNVLDWLVGNKSLTITVYVTDQGGSGAEQISYVVAKDGQEQDPVKTDLTDNKAEIMFSAGFKGNISISCTDNANNTSDSVTVGAVFGGNDDIAGIIIEDKAPSVSFEINNSAVSGETIYYDEAPEVKVTLSDNAGGTITSGIASVTYQVGDGKEETVEGGNFTKDIVPQYSFTIPSDDISTGVNTITVKVEDNAGNTGEASVTVKVKEPEKTPKAIVDKEKVTIKDLTPGAEYDITYEDKAGNPHTQHVTADENGSLGIEDDWIGKTVDIVKKGNGTDTGDSQPQALEIPEREPDISGPLTATDESLKGANDGKIGGLNPGEEYEVSGDGGKTWKKQKADSAGEIEPLAPGSYDVRRPAGEDTWPSRSVHVDIKEGNPSQNVTREETPKASVDRQNGKIKGLIPKAEYDITYEDADGKSHTDTVKADENGNLPIEDDWLGKSVEIVKKGDGTVTVDSLPQNLNIPEREAAPTGAKMTKRAGTNGQGGAIGGLKSGATYQISTDGGKTWKDVTADDKGEISPVESGSYEIRKKAGENTLSSTSVHVEVTKQKKKGSSGSSDDSDNTDSSADVNGNNPQADNTNPPTYNTDSSTDNTNLPGDGSSRATIGRNASDGAPAPTTSKDIPDSVADTHIETAEPDIAIGEGSVRVTVVSDEYQSAAGVADTAAVANAVLTPEQKQLVNNGESIEIRVEVTDISEQVSREDKDIIESGLSDYKVTDDTAGQAQSELTLGAYIDISMYMRIGDGDWDAITQVGEPIEVVIGIPDNLLSDGRTYYIARSHEGTFALLDDMDREPDTITIKTELFSTYAIVYRQTPGEGTVGSRCGLCHICPTFLGICCFIWSVIILAVIGAVTFAILGKRRKGIR